MKKDAQQTLQVTSGKDEMNLVEFPITLLSKRQNDSRKTIKITDVISGEKNQPITREWIVTGSDEFGLPLAMDNDVLLALLIMGKEKDFQSPVINFSRYKVLEMIDQDTKAGSNYKRIEEALDRLTGVRIKAKNAFWDNNSKGYVTVNIGIFDEYQLFEGKPKKNEQHQRRLSLSYVRLNETLFQSIKSGYIKSFDAKLYFGFKSAVTKRLYRYLDKKRYDGKRKFEINLYALAYVHLGFSDDAYKYASDIKKKLDNAHEELIKVGFLKSVEYQKTADGSSEKVTYIFGKKGELPDGATRQITEGTVKEASAAVHKNGIVLKLMEFGITQAAAEQIAREYPTGLIEEQIGALAYRKAEDPAAMLICAIQNNWALPSKYQEQTLQERRDEEEEQQRTQEEREKMERRGKIEKYLSSLSRDEMVELTGEAKKKAREEGGAFLRSREVPAYMVNAYVHMIVEKRLGL